MDTKQRILEEALALFARKGYEGVSVGEIAAAVGIKAPSLYKHFSGKQAIFDGILERMNARYQAQAAALQMDGTDPRKDAPDYAAITEEALTERVTALFSFFLHDPDTSRFRRMLTLEQFQGEDLPRLYSKLYCDDPLSFQGALFRMLPGLEEDPELAALEFYSPIYLLLTLCDRQPEREKEAMALLKKHIHRFYRLSSAN